MRIIFRVDGGYKTGMGHISHCIALAKYMRSVSNAKIIFVTKDFQPSTAWIKQAHFSLCCLGQRIDLKRDADKTLSFLGKEEDSAIITDIPGINEKYLEYLSDNKNGAKLVCIDSYGIKKGIPDILINPGIIKEWYPRWKDVDSAKCFLGPSYWIFDKTYRYYHNKPKDIKKKAKDILISLGGADTSDLMMKIPTSILELNEGLRITVVIGPAFKKFKKLRNLSRKSNQKKIIIKEKVDNLARLMFAADIGIICGGFTLYEAACVGLPCLVICKVPHQLKTAGKFEELGIARTIGLAERFEAHLLPEELKNLISSSSMRKSMSEKGKLLIDAKGTQRVWKVIKDEFY